MRWGDISPLLHSCLGPQGRPKLLASSSVVSSSSKRLLPLLNTSSPFARIVIKAVRMHLSSYGDGGLSCAVLALWLACHPPIARSLPLVGLLYEHFASEFLLIFETEVAFDVDFKDLHHSRCVVRTLLSSKPACCLSRVDSEVVCSLLLRSFLEAVPSRVGVTSVMGLAPSQSRMVRGVVVPLEGDEERLQCMLPEGDGPFCACLFACSLAGEMDWPAEVLAMASKDAGAEASLQHLASVVDMAIRDGVRVFLCQKVVHPRLKKRLHSARVVVLDRLGVESTRHIQCMWGENSGSLGVWYGTLSRPRVESFGRRCFLLLSSRDACQFRSLLLTHHNREALAELEVVCRQSLCALYRLLVRPHVCFGGGCSEITAALLVAKKVCGSLDSVCSEARSTPGHVLCSLESFTRGIAHLCSSIHQGTLTDFATDSESGHLWQQRLPMSRCACGSRDPSSVKPSAWRQLTDIAGLRDILLTSVSQTLSTSSLSASTLLSLPACNNDAECLPASVPQNASTSISEPQTMQTSLGAQQNVSASSAQNVPELINRSTPDSLPSSNGQEILLDELGCKLGSLSLAFETSSMLLKTTECIHTSPHTIVEETKVDDSVF